MNSEAQEPKEHEEILDQQIRTGFREYERSGMGVFLSAFTAGLELGFSILLMGVLYTLTSDMAPENMIHLIVSAGYPVGFIFVIIGRSELFTEQTALAMLPVFNGNTSVKELFQLWGLVIAGNLLGGFLFAIFLTWIGPALDIITVPSFIYLADKMINPHWEYILGSAILAGWMMGLLGWLLTSAQDTISRVFIVIFVTVIIGIGNLHHCIVGSIEMLCGVLISDDITWADYSHFLIFAVLGNTIGGAFFVSTLKYTQLKVQKQSKSRSRKK